MQVRKKYDIIQCICVVWRNIMQKKGKAKNSSLKKYIVAGKGHEDYQEVKGVKHHFDDREIIRGIFNSQK